MQPFQSKVWRIRIYRSMTISTTQAIRLDSERPGASGGIQLLLLLLPPSRIHA